MNKELKNYKITVGKFAYMVISHEAPVVEEVKDLNGLRFDKVIIDETKTWKN